MSANAGEDFCLPALAKRFSIDESVENFEDKFSALSSIDRDEAPLRVCRGDLTICVGWRERGGHDEEALHTTYLCRRA